MQQLKFFLCVYLLLFSTTIVHFVCVFSVLFLLIYILLLVPTNLYINLFVCLVFWMPSLHFYLICHFWALQNFLVPAPAESNLYPARKLLHICNLILHLLIQTNQWVTEMTIFSRSTGSLLRV